MVEEPIRKILRDVGLTEKETDAYIFLAKHGPLKGLEIARRSRTDNAEMYRIIRQLQNKGLVEATLESPSRFTAVPFDKVIDTFVKIRRDEATLVEDAKESLLKDWKKVSKIYQEPLAKFVVVDGKARIRARIVQMMKEAKQQIRVISYPELMQVNQLDFFETVKTHGKARILFQFIIGFSEMNLSATKSFLNNLPKGKITVEGRSPDLGLHLSPRMFIKDEEEILLFTTPVNENSHTLQQSDACLWTNSRELVSSFIGVFENSWANSSDIFEKIKEMERGGSLKQQYCIFDKEAVQKKYDEVLRDAKEKVVAMTSSSGIFNLAKDIDTFEKLAARGIPVNILLPVVRENQCLSKSLSENCTIRSCAETDLTTTVIDECHLFQFKTPPKTTSEKGLSKASRDAHYTNNPENVKKAMAVLDKIWARAQDLVALGSEQALNPISSDSDSTLKMTSFFLPANSLVRIRDYEVGVLTERELVDKIHNAKKISPKNPFKDPSVLYGSHAMAVINRPNSFRLPRIIVDVWHCNKESSFGPENWLTILLWLKTAGGKFYVPVAHLTDNAIAAKWRRGVYAGTPAGENSILVKKNQFEVRVQGNTLFAGWTVPIPLPSKRVLPPCCILFEGHGAVKTCRYKSSIPSGRTQQMEVNRLQAFATLFHASSKFSVPVMEGTLDREAIMKAYPPLIG